MSVTPRKRRRIPRKVLSFEASETCWPSATMGASVLETDVDEEAVGGRDVLLPLRSSSKLVLALTISGVVEVFVLVPETGAEVAVVSSGALSLPDFRERRPMLGGV